MTDFKIRPIAAPRRSALPVPFSDVLSASFETENPILGIARAAQSRQFQRDPDFSLSAFLKKRPDLTPYEQNLADAGSELEALAIEKRIVRERELRATRQAGGWVGMGTDMVAALASPTIFIPIGTGATALGTIGRVAGMSMVAAGLDEIALQAGSETRTAGETSLNILATGVLGTVLGGAVHMMTPREFGAAQKGFGHSEPLHVGAAAQAGLDRQSIGAARVGDPLEDQIARFGGDDPQILMGVLRHEDFAEASLGAKVLDKTLRATSKFSVVARNLMNSNPEVRGIQARLGDGGLYFQRDAPTAPGGTIESRVNHIMRTKLSSALRETEAAYARYYNDTPTPSAIMRNTSEIAGIMPRGGKLSREQFDEQFFIELQKPNPENLPEVQAAAKTLRDNFYRPLFEEMKKLGMLPKDLEEGDVTGGLQYLTHVYNRDAVITKEVQFRAMIERAYQKNMEERYAQKLERMTTANTRTQEDIQDLSLSDEEVTDIQKSILEEREAFAQTAAHDIQSEMAVLRRQIAEYEKLVGLEGPNTNPATPVFPARDKVRELKARRDFLDSLLTDEDRAAIARDNKLRRRSQLLSQSVARLATRQARALGAIEAHEETAIRILRRLTRKAYDFVRESEGLTDEAYAKGVRDLNNDFASNIAELERLEERIHKIKMENPEFETGPSHFEMRVRGFMSTILPPGKLELTEEADRAWALQRIDDALGSDEALDFTRQQVKSLANLREKIEKAPIKDPAAIQKAFDEAWRLEEKQYDTVRKLTTTGDLLEEISNEGPEYARQVLNEWYDDALIDISDRLQTLGERRARLRDRADKLNPERARWRINDLKERITRRTGELREWLRVKAQGEVADDGTVDFSQGGKELAAWMADKIKGDPTRVVGLDLIGERGSEVARILDIPLEEKMEFLETGIDKLVRIYAANVVPDMELVRAGFGVNGAEAMNKVKEVYAARVEKLAATTADDLPKKPRRKADEDEAAFAARQKEAVEEFQEKEAKKLERERRQVLDSLTGQVQRLRHQRGVPANPDTFLYRAGRLLQQWNVLTMMGNVLAPSLVDPVVAVGRYGLRRTFRHAVVPYVTNLRGLRMSQREALYAGGYDLTLQDRAHQLYDLVEDTSFNRTRGEKAADYLANKIGVVGLFSYWTQGMKSWVTPIISGKFFDSLEVHMTGKPAHGVSLAQARQNLAHFQIDDDLAQRIWAQRETGGIINHNGLWIPNTQTWTDQGAREAFHTALVSEIDSSVLTPGLERPLFTDASLAHKLLFQFQSFMWSSHTKILMAGLQRRDWAALEGVMAGFAFGALSFWVDSIARGRELPEDPEVWMDEMIIRSPFLGVMAQGLKIGQDVPATRPFLQFSDEGPIRRFASGPLGDVLGPSYGTGQKLSKMLVELDDPTLSTANTAKQLTPYNNVIWARRMFDWVAENSGFPERRAPE